MKHRELQWRLRLDSVMAHVLTADGGKFLVRNGKEYEEVVQTYFCIMSDGIELKYLAY